MIYENINIPIKDILFKAINKFFPFENKIEESDIINLQLK